jgi:hypothetical protein
MRPDMNDQHEVISAFLDDEPFDAEQLGRALSEPEGRTMLLDLLALRQVMQPVSPHIEPLRKPSPLRAVMAAAAIVVALVGGFWLGERRGQSETAQAPAATRVIEAGEWQALP